MGKVTQSCQRRRGLAIVEAALVMPIIVWLSLAIIEYGWLFHKSYQIGGVARVAARQAAMPDGTSAGVLATVDTLLANANIPAAHITRTVTPSPVEDTSSGDNVTVTIDVVYTGLTTAPLLPVPETLHASVTMNREGF